MTDKNHQCWFISMYYRTYRFSESSSEVVLAVCWNCILDCAPGSDLRILVQSRSSRIRLMSNCCCWTGATLHYYCG